MKIAIVLPPGSQFSQARPNSMETVVRTLAEAASPVGELRIFCCEGATDHGRYPVHLLPQGKQARLAALKQALADFEPDVVEFHQQAIQAVRAAAAVPKAASVLYRHSPLRAPRSVMDRWRYRARYARVSGLVFVSEAERRSFLKDFPELAAKAHAIINPIDAGQWLGDVEDRDPIIAFAGRAMPEKGVDVICAALPQVLDRHPDWKAVLMLNDWQHHSTWAEPHVAPLARYGERVRVMRSAPLGEVREVMRRAAIALTPSVWDEPLGLTALEAHAAGAALISSGRGGLREASGPHAAYLSDITVPALSEGIDQLIADPAGRLAMARAAQTYVLDAHAPQRRAAELIALRTSLMRQARRAPLAGARREGASARSEAAVA